MKLLNLGLCLFFVGFLLFGCTANPADGQGQGAVSDQNTTDNSQNQIQSDNTGQIDDTDIIPDSDPDSSPDNQPDIPSPGVRPPSIHTNVIEPADLVYLGAFKLPGPSGGSDWTWSGRAATFYPGGDSSGVEDGFPGSIYAVGNDQDQMISEVNIPIPVISRNIDDLNTATTLQPFSDVRQNSFPEITDFAYPAMEYLPAQDGQISGKLYLAWGFHLFESTNVNTHSWCELDLSDPRTPSAWSIEGYTPFLTADYLFEIPTDWAAENTPNMRLATGRFREGVWSGRGPALFAYGPWIEGNPPAAGSEVPVIPLLLYGVQEPGALEITSYDYTEMENYCAADQWTGGAWLTKDDKSAVVFVGTHGVGDCWYGFSDGTVWPYDGPYPETPAWPHDQRGFWADSIESQIIFYDPADLAAVASGSMENWEPQPYATLNLDQYLYNPGHYYESSDSKRELVRAVAFDRENGLLYVFEFRADDEGNSIVHVLRVN
ncbi:hypothetical protein KKF81_06010 [Candidatus Micrarchaeota archaeon]|nr:hypothetical protein [Candidatus Micrarchaeota archaeon]MBU1166483.1 hypothetical protein [Candidatus Micrarchaeota archaeon]MBU1886189.1 hypothetical protein [Candidatus Micrarchaeota archaeon]